MFLDSYLLRKETLLELYTVDEYQNGNFTLNEQNICLDRIRFNIDGNSAIHYFALNSSTLNIVLDYMEKHHKGYLTSILMKNKKGKSPVDIAIDTEAPKCIELFLRKLALFSDSKLSPLFYDRFSDLLGMNLDAFHQYLESCYFQTIQMKMSKALTLKSKKDPLLITHSSCLIDEIFMNKY